MARALKLARRGWYTTPPNPRVGCVIVRRGKIIGTGWHQQAGQAHAEIIALQQAGRNADGATVYVTLEPCCHHGRTPPCSRALIRAGVARVVIAVEDPSPQVNRRGIAELQQAGIEVRVGVCRADAQRLNRGFFHRLACGVPWVVLKTAVSLDGKTALRNGNSRWITAPPARQDAHKLRAGSAAIMTGIGTVLCDDPQMTARLEGVVRQPLRVILDRHLRTPPQARILHAPGEVLLLVAGEAEVPASRLRDYRYGNVEIMRIAAHPDGLDLGRVMRELGRRAINDLMLEAGATLSGAMLRQGWVNEVVVYQSPDLLGSDAHGMFRLPGVTAMENKTRLRYVDVRMIGRDCRMTLAPEPN